MYDQTTWVAPLPKPRRGARVTAIVLGTLLLACCAGTGASVLVTDALNGDTSQPDTASGTPDNVEPRGVPGGEDPTAPTPGLNQPVRDGQFEFTVVGINCGHQSVGEQWWIHEAQGEFCIVDLTVRNIGTDARHFGDGAQRAKGPEGNTYAADTGAGVIVNGNGDAVWNVVNPGNSIAAKIVFDVPPGATLSSLELHDSPFSGGVTVRVAESAA